MLTISFDYVVFGQPLKNLLRDALCPLLIFFSQKRSISDISVGYEIGIFFGPKKISDTILSKIRRNASNEFFGRIWTFPWVQIGDFLVQRKYSTHFSPR